MQQFIWLRPNCHNYDTQVMKQLHIGAIPITKPAKQSYAIPMFELKSPKTLSSGPNFANLNIAKAASLL